MFDQRLAVETQETIMKLAKTLAVSLFIVGASECEAALDECQEVYMLFDRVQLTTQDHIARFYEVCNEGQPTFQLVCLAGESPIMIQQDENAINYFDMCKNL